MSVSECPPPPPDRTIASYIAEAVGQEETNIEMQIEAVVKGEAVKG